IEANYPSWRHLTDERKRAADLSAVAHAFRTDGVDAAIELAKDLDRQVRDSAPLTPAERARLRRDLRKLARPHYVGWPELSKQEQQEVVESVAWTLELSGAGTDDSARSHLLRDKGLQRALGEAYQEHIA